MPAFASFPEARMQLGLALAVLITLFGLWGCQGSESEGRFEVDRIDVHWANGDVTVEFRQKITLSQEARNALIHGVPLTLELEMILRNTASQNHVAGKTSRYELSFLPLSEYYQLANLEDNSINTFPRLRHALAHLAQIRLSFETGVLPAGDYELMARSRLDKSSMPPPMRLPVLFSSRWRHESDWSSWPLTIDPGA